MRILSPMGWAFVASILVVLLCYAVSSLQIYRALSHFDVPQVMAREVNRWAAL